MGKATQSRKGLLYLTGRVSFDHSEEFMAPKKQAWDTRRKELVTFHLQMRIAEQASK